MKYRLTPEDRAERIERRAKMRAEKIAERQSLRDWFEARRMAAHKRRTEAAQQPTAPRGVDRVPESLQVDTPAPEYVVEHSSANYQQRRAWSRATGRSLPSSKNTPHVNPDRDRKRHARLRAS